MRTASRLIATAAAVLTAGLALTACDGPGTDSSSAAGSASSTAGSVSSAPAPAASGKTAPGARASADLLYSDVNGQASASGRHVCAVTGSKVSIILPNTTQQTQVAVTGGVDNGTLDVCGGLDVDPFASSQG
ncbi:hypothetical protein ACFWIQ_04655 [Kitasatospora sp. NPDC127059]|uniref:hypothetical protein n=1 Tax=unclassified Kitasatospora TaxID=2633591 RepID=UPI0036510FC5